MPRGEDVGAAWGHAGVNGRSGTIAETGRWRVRYASGEGDVDRAQALRFRAFRGADPEGRDCDRFDAVSRHVLVEERRTGALAATCRLRFYPDGGALDDSYAAQFYDLAGLARKPGPMLELGRFCVAPDFADGEVLRLAWGALTRIVDDEGVRFLFGCTSFKGTEPGDFGAAFALLAEKHLAPAHYTPGERAPEVHRLGGGPAHTLEAARAALGQIPSLLRSYLALGGWVSDHAVIDRDLGTIHVFTGLDMDVVSPARLRVLRAMLG